MEQAFSMKYRSDLLPTYQNLHCWSYCLNYESSLILLRSHSYGKAFWIAHLKQTDYHWLCYHTRHSFYSQHLILTKCSIENELILLLKSVDPPDKTTLEKSIRRRSMSDFRIEYARTSCIPSNSSPIKSGRNRTSGARNFAGPI